jgi:hypothetical protein
VHRHGRHNSVVFDNYMPARVLHLPL